jgi:hypothetical protein
MAGVITLTEEDHRKLERVFRALESAQPVEVPALLRQVAELLIQDSKAEEAIVRPAIRASSPGEESDVADGVAQHHHIAETLRQLLAADTEAPGTDGPVAAMIGGIRHHVEEEEREILARFAKDATSTQLDLGAEFTTAKKHIPEEIRAGVAAN